MINIEREAFHHRGPSIINMDRDQNITINAERLAGALDFLNLLLHMNIYEFIYLYVICVYNFGVENAFSIVTICSSFSQPLTFNIVC